MRVEFYTFDDYAEWLNTATEDEAKELAKLFGWLTIELDRVPMVGEYMTFVKGGYFVGAHVEQVSMSWVEPGNPHMKPGAYGAHVGVSLRGLEVLEFYDSKESNDDTEYRPYANAEEFFKACQEHGEWILDGDIFQKPLEIHESYILVTEGVNRVAKWTYEFMVEEGVWADDGSPCGVKED